MILWDNSYVYATDPNKNVRVKRFPDEWMGSGWIEEFFDYKPFGELKNYVQSKPRFMFSSEEYMPETGMYHYLYRAYSPSLARFITRDPIEEQGGVNLYCFVGNNPVSYWDVAGNARRRTTKNTNNKTKAKDVGELVKNCSKKLSQEDISLKELLTDEMIDILIEEVKNCITVTSFDGISISKDILEGLGLEFLAKTICCVNNELKDEVGYPCDENYKKKGKIQCTSCCDFNRCVQTLQFGLDAFNIDLNNCYCDCQLYY